MKPLVAAVPPLSNLDPAGAVVSVLQISRAGSRAVNTAPAENFAGHVDVEMVYTPTGPDRTSVGLVSFSRGARTAWHAHPLGQTLVVTAGIGRVQSWGGIVEEIRPGDVVHIPPGVKHWHGAAPDSTMTHFAIQEARYGKTAHWCEQVSDAQYRVAPARTESPIAPTH